VHFFDYKDQLKKSIEWNQEMSHHNRLTCLIYEQGVVKMETLSELRRLNFCEKHSIRQARRQLSTLRHKLLHFISIWGLNANELSNQSRIRDKIVAII